MMIEHHADAISGLDAAACQSVGEPVRRRLDLARGEVAFAEPAIDVIAVLAREAAEPAPDRGVVSSPRRPGSSRAGHANPVLSHLPLSAIRYRHRRDQTTDRMADQC